MANPIDDILASRTGNQKEDSVEDTSKFFSTLATDGYQENFLELRFQEGFCTCFSYADLNWFNHDPEEGTLDLEFGGFLISIIGRGLGGKLFHAIKSKRASWVKEADSDFQDSPDNDLYIEQILVRPPEGFSDEGEEETE